MSTWLNSKSSGRNRPGLYQSCSLVNLLWRTTNTTLTVTATSSSNCPRWDSGFSTIQRWLCRTQHTIKILYTGQMTMNKRLYRFLKKSLSQSWRSLSTSPMTSFSLSNLQNWTTRFNPNCLNWRSKISFLKLDRFHRQTCFDFLSMLIWSTWTSSWTCMWMR